MSSKQITPIHRDHLAIMPEEEIRMKVQQVRGWIESGRRRGQATQDLEVEYCYLAEELKLREARRRAYEEYLRRNPQAAENESYN